MNDSESYFVPFLTASVVAFSPVVGLALVPNTWWGITIKLFLSLFLIGVIGNLMKPTIARDRVYGASAPGFVICMPLLFIYLVLSPGIAKTVFLVLFVLLSLTNYGLMRNKNNVESS